MSARFFLDTNLFVYSLEGTGSDKARRAKQLVQEAIATHNGIVSYQVVQEFFHVAFRRFTPPMTTPEAEQYFVAVFRPLLTVHSSAAIYVQALSLRSRYKFSWYDCVLLAGAIEGGCGLLYSEDMQHGQIIGELRIENPFR